MDVWVLDESILRRPIMLDWGLALGIAGGGIASVFIVLLTLAFIIWIISLISRRAASKNKND